MGRGNVTINKKAPVFIKLINIIHVSNYNYFNCIYHYYMSALKYAC